MDDVIQAWLQIGEYANLAGIHVVPRAHPSLPDTPLISTRGQAAACHLRDDQGGLRILKKFLPGRSPDVQYISRIRSLVPCQPGFESGYERHVLSSSSIDTTGYFTPELAQWIENTILMQVVDGNDWATLADSLRAGSVSLSVDQRLSLCLGLSEKVRLLEAHDLSHRDLSSTNIFVDSQNLDIHFIDWDSLYDATLTMPDNTTFGTSGYTAPFVKVNGKEDAQISWGPYADRFSLAILNAEFLSMDVNSPMTGDGGAFEQDELYNRGGAKIDDILDRVKLNCPRAVALIEQALNATGFDNCPSPGDWTIAAGGKRGKAAAANADSHQGFVSLDRSAFVKLKRSDFVKLYR